MRIGCFIANKEGRKVIGVSAPKKSDEWLTVSAGNHEEIFDFCVTLWPGYYFIGCGISEMESGGSYLHRVIDSYVIRVESESRLVQVGDTCLDISESIQSRDL